GEGVGSRLPRQRPREGAPARQRDAHRADVGADVEQPAAAPRREAAERDGTVELLVLVFAAHEEDAPDATVAVAEAEDAVARSPDDAKLGQTGQRPPQESPGPFTRRHAPASYRSLVIPSGEFPALCAAGRRGAGAPPGRGAATHCALQAVAAPGPRR